MLICIEGMDGVGKTAISNNVSTMLNIPMTQKPINKLLNLTQEQSQEITEKIYSSYSSHIQASYYLLGYLSVLEDSKKRDLLMDRGFLSTFYFSFNDENSFLFDTFIENYGPPDMTFILYASIDERIRRIQQRDYNDYDLNKKRLYLDGYERFFEGIKRYNFPYLLINTENLSELEITKIVSTLVSCILTKKECVDSLTELFSIENLSNMENLSCEDIISLVNEKICEKQTNYRKVKEK